jgi:hypothetical protein
MRSAQIIHVDWSDIWMDPRPINALVLGCRDGAQESEPKTLWKSEGKQNLRERCDLEDLGTDGTIVLSGSSGHRMGVWTGLIWLMIRLL